MLDPVGTGTERRLEHGRGYVAPRSRCIVSRPPVLGQHVELADNSGQLSISGRIEREGDFTLARDLGFDDVLVIGGKPRAVFLERVEGKQDILGRNRGAVMPFRLRA